MSTFNLFFLVWNERTGYAKYKHQAEGDAKKEAERLAEQNRGDEFYVLQAVGKAKSVTVEYSRAIPSDEIPF